MMIAWDSIVAASTEQLSSDLADEVVILNLQNGMYYGLNPVGSFVWQRIQQPTRVAQLHDLLLQHYSVDAATCANDLLVLLEELAAAALIVVEPAQEQPDHV